MLFQLLWLFLLGLITYLILQRSTARITQASVWVLWLVMMTPALSWVTWVAVYGDRQPIPTVLIVVVFVLCLLMYGLLVQLGRQPSPQSNRTTSASTPDTDSSDPVEHRPPPRPITADEENTLRNCFPWTVFPLRNLEYRPQAVICRGQLRSQPEIAYQTIRDKIENHFGDRFVIVFQKDLNNQPFFAVIANPYRQNPSASPPTDPLNRAGLAIAFLLITLFTTTVAGVGMREISTQTWLSNPSLLLQGLAYSLPLMMILGSHELAHYIMAKWYHIRITLPFFIPVPFFLGTFGALTQIRSPLPHRKALFDVSLIGPWIGFGATLICLGWGLGQSEVVSVPAEEIGILSFKALDPSFSLLLTILSKLALGAALTADKAIHLHPVAIAGYLGLLVTAFNLLPIGQLDGGHMIHAMFGQRTAIIVGQVTRFLVLILSLIQGEFLILAILLFFLTLNDEPALNDVTELDNFRDLLGLITLALLLMILLPMPRMLAVWMNY